MQRNVLDTSNNTCKNFYFVRHGATNWSFANVLNGKQDLPLNYLGRYQAREAALTLKKFINDFKHAKIVSSPLQRAKETAREIELITNIPIYDYKKNLEEFDYGDYSKTGSLSITPPDAESQEAFQERVRQVSNALLHEYSQSEPLIIVSHQKVFEYLTEYLTQQKISLTNAGVAHFTCDENGVWEVNVLDVKKDTKSSLYMQDLFPKRPIKTPTDTKKTQYQRSYYSY